MNGAVHLFCLSPRRAEQYFLRTVGSNGEEWDWEGRDWGRMRRFYEIVAKLRKLLKTLP